MFIELLIAYSLNNIGQNELRINFLLAFSILGLSFIIALPVLLILYYFLRFRAKNRNNFDQMVVLPLSFTLTSFLAFLAFLVYSLFLLVSSGGLDLFLLVPLVPMFSHLVLSISFYQWYRYRFRIFQYKIILGEEILV